MNTHLTELVKTANRNRALLKRSRPPTGHHYIYSLHSKKLNLSYVGKTKMSMQKRMSAHKHPNSYCTGTQLFAMGDPEWSILEIVPTEDADEREEWHIANTRAATNVNAVSRPMDGFKLRERIRLKKKNATRDPEEIRQTNRACRQVRNAEAVALGYKNHYQRLKAERIAAGFII
jgi:hypothetical protein